MMNMKKLIAFLLAVMLIIPTALWADTTDKELANLIALVKEKIDVPSELTEFRYSVNAQNEGTREISYTLSWEDKAYKLGNLQITVEKNGNIISYSKNIYDNTYSILAKVSYEEGLKKAKTFLNKVVGDNAKDLKLQEAVSTDQSNNYVYTFNHYVNGVKVFNEAASVYVNKQTGEVISFYGIPTYKGTYSTPDAKISLEKAKENYLRNIGVTLWHSLYSNYETRSVSSFPVYEISNGQNKGIDAVTGQIIIPHRDYFYGGFATAEMAEGKADGGSRGLTPQEEAAVEETKGLLTQKEALSAGAKYFPKLLKASVQSASLYKSTYDNQYIWHINLQSADTAEAGVSAEKIKLMIAAGDTKILPPEGGLNMNLSVDAKTGEVLSYNSYNNYENKESTVSADAVKGKVEAFLKTIAKDKFALTEYYVEEAYSGPIPMDVSKSEPYKTYYYRRVVNGVPVKGNGLRVTYDTVHNEVTSYSNEWTQVAFKDVKKVIDKKKIIDQIGLELMYINKDEKTRVLAYAHPESYMSFDPYKGIRVNSYDGKPINQPVPVIYGDIAGHPKEAIIKKLYDSGIYLSGTSFKPDMPITQVDFLRFVLKAAGDNISEEDLYSQAVNRGILGEKEKNKDLLMTREQSVKYMINSTNYKEIAKLSDIYQYPFKDEKELTAGLKGYVTLAYGLKLIEKDKTNLFNPQDKLTRAEAAQMVYNMLIQEK